MKILVHLHLYYQNMLPEMLGYLANLDGYDYDLYVTVVKPEAQSINQLKDFKPDAKIIAVENRGYDVAPFVYVLQQVDLNSYDYIIKIHTKQTLKSKAYLPNVTFVKNQWRNLLFGFMENKEQFRQTIALFDDQDVGMVSHYNLIIKAKTEDKVANQRADGLMQKMGLVSKEKKYVAGTMFMVRAGLFKPLQNHPHQLEDFELYNQDVLGGSLAHAYERLFGYVISAQKHKIVSYTPETKLTTMGHLLRKIGLKTARTLVQVKINRKNKLIIKICKIPVCSIQLKN